MARTDEYSPVNGELSLGSRLRSRHSNEALRPFGSMAVRVRHGGSLDFPSDWHRSAMNLAGVIFCVVVAISEEQCEGVLAGGREGVCMWAL